MSEWKKITLGKLGKTYGGLTGKTKEDFGKGDGKYIPYLNIFNSSEIDLNNLESIELKPGEHQNSVQYGDIFFTTSSETIEEVGMSSVLLRKPGGKVYLNSFCFGFRQFSFEFMIPEFAKFFFRGEKVRERITFFGQGSTRYNLSKINLLKGLELALPPLPQQKKIAAILSTVDAQIEATEELIRKYEMVKEGLMQDLFTRGIDPQTGKLRPRYEDAPELYKESVLGWIPREWEVKKVDQLIVGIEQGWSPDCSSEPASNGEWGVLKTTAVTWNGYAEHQNKSLPLSLSPRPLLEVKAGDVLMTRGGPNSRVGVVAYVGSTQKKLMLSDKIYRIVPKNIILNEYLAMALSSSPTQSHLSSFKTGMAESQTNISQAIVKRLNICFRGRKEQHAVLESIGRIEKLIFSKKSDLFQCNQLKQGLMQDLLTGNRAVKV